MPKMDSSEEWSYFIQIINSDGAIWSPQLTNSPVALDLLSSLDFWFEIHHPDILQ